MFYNDVRDYHTIKSLVSDINNDFSALRSVYNTKEYIAADYAVDAAADNLKSNHLSLKDATDEDFEVHLNILHSDHDVDFDYKKALQIAKKLAAKEIAEEENQTGEKN